MDPTHLTPPVRAGAGAAPPSPPASPPTKNSRSLCPMPPRPGRLGEEDPIVLNSWAPRPGRLGEKDPIVRNSAGAKNEGGNAGRRGGAGKEENPPGARARLRRRPPLGRASPTLSPASPSRVKPPPPPGISDPKLRNDRSAPLPHRSSFAGEALGVYRRIEARKAAPIMRAVPAASRAAIRGNESFRRGHVSTSHPAIAAHRNSGSPVMPRG